jgi:hypothetical protein
MPEPLALEGYLGHFFELSEGPNASIAFRDHSGRSLVITSQRPRFHLVGNRLCDASEVLGPLFGGSPPRVCISGGTWQHVGAIVIGEEGRGRRKWRTSLELNRNVTEQELPAEIVERKTGWYFMRFYDLRGELTDSLDFRFVAGLGKITIPDGSPLPSPEGHRQIVIEFCHEQGCQVKPSPSCPEDWKIESGAERTAATVPPVPALDRSLWLAGYADSPGVPVTILLERIWWALSDGHQSDLIWQDRCLPCARSDLRANSDKVISLRLPRQSWAGSVRVGFSKISARQYRTRVGDPVLTIPLRDFGDSPKVAVVGTLPLMLYVRLAEMTYETPLCVLSVRAGCKFDAFTAASEDELFSHVRSLHLQEFFPRLILDELRKRES